MKYLVLGSSGQIGSHFCEVIKGQGLGECVKFDVAADPSQDLRYDNNKLIHIMEFGQIDMVIFLAFDVGGAKYLSANQNQFGFIDNNVRLMQKTFTLLSHYQLPFIFASSQMSTMSQSPYGALKAVGEHYTRSLGGLVVHFWNVFGREHDKEKFHVITDFINQAKAGNDIHMLTDGNEERQFIHADEASFWLAKLAMHYKEIPRHEPLHITSHQWTKIKDIAQIVADYYGVKVSPGKMVDATQGGHRFEPDMYARRWWSKEFNLQKDIESLMK